MKVQTATFYNVNTCAYLHWVCHYIQLEFYINWFICKLSISQTVHSNVKHSVNMMQCEQRSGAE